MSSLPNRLAQWEAAATESGTRWGVDTCLVLAVLERESRGGVALQPATPGGTGDWAPRRWAKYVDRPEVERFFHWLPAHDEYQKLFPRRHDWPQDICLPADKKGWGRGLMQPDWADPSNYEFLSQLETDGTPSWQNGPKNIDAGARKLSLLIKAFDGQEDFAAAAYNAGEEAVREALRSITSPATDWRLMKAVDSVTTGGNYASDVMQMRERFRRVISTRTPQPSPIPDKPK